MVGTVEVCLDSFASAQLAAGIVNSGDNRIELCSNLIYGGGLTPTLGLLRHCATVVTGRRFMVGTAHSTDRMMLSAWDSEQVMIRPRLGSFVYSPSEVETMLSDIAAFKSEPSVRGFVFGCLYEDGRIDVEATTRLVDACRPFEVAFHRAFDLTPDYRQAFSDIWGIPGITRVLTSGHAPTAPEGTDELRDLSVLALEAHQRYPERGSLTVLPGSGIGPATVAKLKEQLPGLKEVHLTASRAVERRSQIAARGAELGFGSDVWVMDAEKLTTVWDLVKGWDD